MSQNHNLHITTTTTRSLLLFTFVLLTIHLSSIECGSSNGIISTKIGKIKGTSEVTKKGTDYKAFRGLRYANAPVKALRFKEPQPISPWEGELNGEKDGPACPQLHIATNKVIGDEDCLSLNIYTPKNVDDLKPVVVFLHGGGFTTGTGSSLLYGPDFFMDQNVVLVTIQYRLGAFGFLSTESDDSRGNWGLYDQILALKYVKDNIVSFGGKPEQVTLMGEGAGAASASFLTLTEKSKGLFRNVILLGGGSALNSQYFQKTPIESARELASRLACSYEEFAGLVKCLREADTEKVVREVSNMFSFFSFPRWFAPSVDSVLFKKSPEELLKDGKNLNKVPILTGLARHEGSFYYPLTLNSFSDGTYNGDFIDKSFPRLLPVISEFESRLLPLTKAVKKRYFTNIDIDNEDEFRPRYVEFLTDLLYTRFTHRYAKLVSDQNVPLYYFLLDYYGTNSLMHMLGEPTDSKWATHGDILQYLFTQVLGEDKELPDDDLNFAAGTLLPFIVNFVKTSIPTPPTSVSSFGEFTCPIYDGDTDGIAVCLLGKSLSIVQNYRANILKFWDQEVPKIYSTKKKEEL